MKRAAIIMAAAMAVAAIDIVPAGAASGGTTGGPTTAPTTMHASVKGTHDVAHPMAVEPAHAKIQRAIASLTDDAMTPKGMSRLVSLFADAQRQRIAKSGTYAADYGDQLNLRIESISRAWKQKYGHDFAISKTHDALSSPFASIRMGSPGHNNAAADSAIVAITGFKGTAELQVPLVCDKNNDWKVNVPNSLTAQRLRDNLQAQLADVDSRAAHWPANEADAYRLVADHVLIAILDRPIVTYGQAPATTQPAAKLVRTTASPAVKPASAAPSHSWWQFWNW